MKLPSTPYLKLAVLAMASFCSFSSKAQVPPTAAGYLFTAYPGTYTPITGGTNIAILGDDVNVQNLPIGFTFPFATGTYTTFTANSNGWVALGNKGPTATQMRTNTAANAGVIGPMVMALWDDLNGSPNGQASYLTTGVAPNRVLTVQFNNWKWIWTGTGNSVMSFQVKLFESGRIELHYQQGPDNINATAAATIGIARNGTDYQTLNNATANPTVSSTTFYDGVNVKAPNGQVYAWDAPLPNNTSVAAIPQPGVDICVGQHAVAAQVKNEGGNIINNVRVNWSVDGNIQPFVTYTTPIPIGGTSAAIPLGNTMLPVSTFTHKIKVWTSHPNGLTDPKPENDTLQVSRKPLDPPSAFMFFEKTRICPGDSLLLWAPYDPIYTYVWQYEADPIAGATDSAIWVKKDGNYSVKVFNPACSSQSAFHKITVKPAMVDLGGDSSMCETIPSQILDADEANASYIWSTGDTTQTIPVWETGKYWVEVKLSPYCMASDTVNLEIKPLPKINGISYVLNGTTYEFEPGGPQFVDTYLWDFGDGNTSTDMSPTHTYAQAGIYDVTLKVFNSCGVTTTQLKTPVGVDDVITEKNIFVYPNPASSAITIDSRGTALIREYRVYNVMGSLLSKFTANVADKKLVVDVSAYPAGTYTIVINTTEGSLNKTFQVMK